MKRPEARSGPSSMEELDLNPVSLIDCEVYDAFLMKEAKAGIGREIAVEEAELEQTVREDDIALAEHEDAADGWTLATVAYPDRSRGSSPVRRRLPPRPRRALSSAYQRRAVARASRAA